MIAIELQITQRFYPPAATRPPANQRKIKQIIYRYTTAVSDTRHSRGSALLSGIIFIWVIPPVILQIPIVFGDIDGLHRPRLVDAETA